MNRVEFAEARSKFEAENQLDFIDSIVPVDGQYKKQLRIKRKGKKLEEYYKWEFIYAMLKCGLIAKDYLCVEVYFPKGNIKSQPLKIDGCIFDDKTWIEHYKKWRDTKDNDSVTWLQSHLIMIIEFKREDDKKTIESIFTSQIKPAMKESDRIYCVGAYYNEGRLHLFSKSNNTIQRFDDSKNGTNDLQFEIPDAYYNIPSFEQLLTHDEPKNDFSDKKVKDLEIITGIHSMQIQHALKQILIDMDKVSLVSQEGYKILIQTLAMKIFDEKNCIETKNNIKFYISNTEKNWEKLSDDGITCFIERMEKIKKDSKRVYRSILNEDIINWQNNNHVKVATSIVENIQPYSITRSAKSDLYQLIFYKFANEFAKTNKGQFITPLQLISFLVKIINPKKNELIVDPTVGTADFLSTAYVNADGELNDENLYGIDNDVTMILLSKLNMLLNGDGNARLEYQSDMGSLTHKFTDNCELIELDYKTNKNGKWDERKDSLELLKFDIVLTNPPFGKSRKFEANTSKKKKLAKCYEIWNIAQKNDSIDQGLMFLENAYRILKENGRIGIVLSNSIMGIDEWKNARKWILQNMRVVAIFDIPSGAFADANINSTLLVAYVPDKKSLEKLKDDDYQIFSKKIDQIGYEIVTKDRIKYFRPIYIYNDDFEAQIDKNGNMVTDENFTATIDEFKEWASTQEETLQRLFL